MVLFVTVSVHFVGKMPPPPPAVLLAKVLSVTVSVPRS